MPTEFIQTAFTGGEQAPELNARSDIEKRGVGVALMKNCFVRAAGGASNRPGTRFITEIKDSTKTVRLIPFQFNTEQTYVLEFGDQYMRVVKDGGQVLEPAFTITGATQANPVVVTTSAAHSYVNGEEVFISGVVGMTEINSRQFILANVTATTYELVGEDGTGHTAYISGGTSARIFTLTTPYLEADLPLLNFTQSADVMTICHTAYDPRDLGRTSDFAWTLTPITFGPGVAAPTGLGLVYSGAGTGITYTYVITATDPETGEESIASTSANQAGDLSTSGDFLTVTWTTVAGLRYSIFRENDGSGFFGFVGQSETGTFIDRNIVPETSISPVLATRDPFTGAFNDPGVVTYYQQRKAFAQSINGPQTLWMSTSANYDNMNVSSPAQADDAVTFTMAARQVNEIRHLIPMADLLVFTSGGEWLATGSGQNQVITPTSIQFTPQSFFGSSDVRPVVIGNTVLFVQEKGAIIRDLAYTFETDQYTGSDLSVLARHLFEGQTVKEWDYALSPFSVVWTVRDDGILLGLTYLKEHRIWAWHQHETAGLFESVAVVTEGNEDAVYFVIRRRINGVVKRYIERFASRLITDVKDAFFVDSGLTRDIPITITGATQANPVVITSTGHPFANGVLVDIDDVIGMTEINGRRFKVANVAVNTYELTDELTSDNIDGTGFSAYDFGGVGREAVTTLSGLDHLDGEEVTILADGSVEPLQTVVNGSITLAAPSARVHAGLPYQSDLQTHSPTLVTQEGATQGKKRKAVAATLELEKSRGLWFGPTIDHLVELKQRSTEPMGSPIALFTGTRKETLAPNWQTNGSIYMQQRDPLPLTVLGITWDLEVGD